MPTIAYIGLGSNIGNKIEACLKAIELLASAGRVTRASSLYCTEPVGYAEQEDFVNAVVEIETALSATELLKACQSIEDRLGRRRTVRWGPRTMDLDILLYGDAVLETPELSIPHPLMASRRFVLVPLCEIAPHALHPRLKKKATELLGELKDTHRVVVC